jgi:hypothetical protein
MAEKMSRQHLPYMKWYPTDWRADPSVQRCSLAARGLWVEMLGIMHEAIPRGHLLIGKSPPSPRELANICRGTLKEVNRLLIELLDAGVYDLENGIIINRRMVREEKKAEIDRENGRKGGSPILKLGVNPKDKAHYQSPESNTRKEDSPAGAGSSKYAFEDGIIRLNRQDFDAWSKAFSHIDLAAELMSLSKWAESEGKNWFFAVKGALAKRNREIKASKDKMTENGGFRWNGQEGVI